jgi:hypothetical protein
VSTVAKLETLLGRIQKNRRPRPAGAPAAAKPMAAVAPVRREVERAPMPEPEPPSQEIEIDRLRAPRPTPMEMALEEGLDTMDGTETLEEVEITIDEDDEREAIAQAAPTAPVGTPAVAAPPPTIEPSPIALPAAKASAPVARAISRAPEVETLTFGELLERTLALRRR